MSEPATPAAMDFVEFAPSKMLGAAATIVRFHRDRVEFFNDGQWRARSFAQVAPQEHLGERIIAWVRRQFGIQDPLSIGEFLFDKTCYPNSYVRLFLNPTVTVFMPSNGQARYPDSAFWRVLKLMEDAPYRLQEFDGEIAMREAFLKLWPAWVGRVGYALFFVGWLYMASVASFQIYIGGSPHYERGPNGEFYAINHGRLTEVSKENWHLAKTLQHTPFAALGVGAVGVLLRIYSKPAFRVRYRGIPGLEQKT